MSKSEIQPDIHVSNLNKSFVTSQGTLEVIKGVSFDVKQGEILCLIGPSGCGKTTILRILAGLEKSESGEINLAVNSDDRFAFLHQTPVLLAWRTVFQNAGLGAELRTNNIESGDIARVHRLLDIFGLADFASYMPNDLSGGMRQRLSVVRALSSNPDILLCDEPFSAIDYVARFELNTQFRRICKHHKITCVFITHNIEEAIYLADTLIVLSSRPCREISRHFPNDVVDKDSAFACRESSGFDSLFREVWGNLRY